METLTVLRVIAEGAVTSFRYPHFAQGVHPTFEMPPPATIYGHTCSALGAWIDNPDTLRFGYTFTHGGKFEDFEHLHFKDGMNPYRRHLLFEPHLTLYLDYPDLDLLYQAFRSPSYAVALGRSQDLMTYTSVDFVTLEQAEQAYFEGTLLPADNQILPYISGSTVTLTMARYVNEHRHPMWQSYAMLRGKTQFPAEDILAAGAPKWVWVDPEVHEWSSYPGLARAVQFHRFVEASDAIPG